MWPSVLEGQSCKKTRQGFPSVSAIGWCFGRWDTINTFRGRTQGHKLTWREAKQKEKRNLFPRWCPQTSELTLDWLYLQFYYKRWQFSHYVSHFYVALLFFAKERILIDKNSIATKRDVFINTCLIFVSTHFPCRLSLIPTKEEFTFSFVPLRFMHILIVFTYT